MDGLSLIPCKATDSSNKGTEVTLYSGNWGNWVYKYCPSGSFISGIRFRVHEDAGWWYDDTSVNGVEIECRETNGKHRGDYVVVSGCCGSW